MVDSSAPPGVRNYPPSSPPPALRRLAVPLLLAVAGAGLFALYLLQSRTAPFSSDGASSVLQAQSILGGNPLLRGWWTSDVSFYTTELPEYVLVTALRGLSPDVVHWCGALGYTLTVLLAALLAQGRSVGRGAGWRGSAIAAGIMLAPSLLGGTEVFLEEPDHAGTAVPLLALLLLLDRAGRPACRRYAPWAAAALLALAQAGDELTLVAATVPLALVAAVRLLRPAPARAAERRQDAALLAAAVASVLLARLTEFAARAMGGFDQRALAGVAPAPPGALPGNAGRLWQSLVLLFGANQPGPPHQARTISAHALLAGMAGLHGAGLLLAGAGLLAGVAAVASGRADRVTAILVTAVAVVTAVSLGSTLLRSLSNAHEVAVLLPLGAALAGRALPAQASRFAAGRRAPGRRPAPCRRRPGRLRAVTALALGGWLAVSLAELGYAASWPAAPLVQQAVAGWLGRHHLRAGLAGYWQADATTVASGGRVLVAPVVFAGRAGVQADRWEASAAWYQPGARAATFVIATDGPAAPVGLPEAEVRARFGPPAAEQRIGPEVILLYRYNLLTRVSGSAFPGGPG
jgi:hypothetical protein